MRFANSVYRYVLGIVVCTFLFTIVLLSKCKVIPVLTQLFRRAPQLVTQMGCLTLSSSLYM